MFIFIGDKVETINTLRDFWMFKHPALILPSKIFVAQKSKILKLYPELATSGKSLFVLSVVLFC